MSNKRLVSALIKQYKLQQKSHWLFEKEPSLELVLINLLNFVTVHFQGASAPLVEECIINAFSRVDESRPLIYNVKSFLQDVVKDAYLLLEKRIAFQSPNGNIAWIPMQEPISIFLKRYACDSPVMIEEKDDYVSISKSEASLMLAVQIMPAYAVSMALSSIYEVCSNG